ncbi:MAG: S8 family serine peptidase [Erysipelotrichaceae bacterium]|nr:S8 family serine peptidase [Erysipelotrichaceae bacterium]
MKKVFKIILVGFMLTTGMFTSVYAEPDENDEDTEVLPAEEAELETEEVDPSTLRVHKLGEDVFVDADLDSKQEYDDDEVVRVSIVLDSPATLEVYDAENVVDNDEAMAYRDSLADEQEIVTKRIERKLGDELDVEWNLTLAANIISANVAYGDIETIKNVYGVNDVFVENKYEIMEDEVNTSISTEYMVYASDAWREGYTGAGSRIAIIDTGVNQGHISFDPDALIYALEGDDTKYEDAVADYNLLTPEEIESVLDRLNQNNTDNKHNISSVDYVYKNTKLPFAFNYIDGNNTTDHFSDKEGNHGSHVAGIAAANRYVKIDGEYVDSLEATHAVGVAPDAQILVMKVFGKGGGAYDSDCMAAIEDAIILKADSVNLSLGSGNPGFSFAGVYQTIMENLVNSSTAVVFSAGNAYHWSAYSNTPYGDLYLDDISLATNGSSGSFANSLSVASATNVGYTGKPLKYDGNSIYYSEPAESEFGNKPISTLKGDQEFVFIIGNINDSTYVYGTDEDFAEVADVLEGKIGMCYRGGISFYEKANAAVKNGAIATIIVNNQKGLISMGLKGQEEGQQYDYTAPVIMIQENDGEMIWMSDYVEEHVTENGLYYLTGTITVTDELASEAQTDREDAEIDDFSSWGVSGSLILKPEITAPGGNIWSVEGMTQDEYISYSGTSMAAPHVSGMVAILSQYFKENENISDLIANTEGLTARTLMNSLLMSTATPMFDEYGLYYPVIRQGAGLGDVYAATQAKTYIMMSEGSTLLSSTAKDGKVKAELGQDKDRTGSYSYSFTINNFSDEDLTYSFDTDLFTQDAYAYADEDYAYQEYLDICTLPLEATVRYYEDVNSHDVDMDGDTDTDDVQAILDYVTGVNDGSELDLEAGELDNVSGISSADAQLLLQWIDAHENDLVLVPAGGSTEITVSIELDSDQEPMYRQNGAYVEGFTYVIPESVTAEGEILDVEHSIPILGYYGNWTDPSMYDAVSYVDNYYPTGKESYFNENNITNFMTIQYPETYKKNAFVGNPYIAEEEFPYDKLAISSDTTITSITTTLIRNAANTATLVLDENGSLIYSDNLDSDVDGAFFYVNGNSWEETASKVTPINKKAPSFGLSEGDKFLIGQFAVPEYYGLFDDPNTTDGNVTVEEMVELFNDGTIGEGSYVGYTMTVDDTVPVIEKVSLSDDKTVLTVTASDNQNIALLGIMDAGGTEFVDGVIPEKDTDTYEFEVTEEMLKENAVVIFTGDYAGNESAVFVKLGDGPIYKKVITEIYRLTDTLEADNDYVISSAKSGRAAVLKSNGLSVQSYVWTSSDEVEVHDHEDGNYILADDLLDADIWSAYDGITLVNNEDGGYLGCGGTNYDWGYPFVSWPNANYGDHFTYDADENALYNYPKYGEGLYYQNGYFYYYLAGPVYLFVSDEIIEYETIDDPNVASSIEIEPESAMLILGAIDEIDLYAHVGPPYLTDEQKKVKWASSDESVVAVDENGHVTTVGVGTATVTATSVSNPNISASSEITVAGVEPMEDTFVFGQVAYGDDDIEFALIDLSDSSTYKIDGDEVFSAFYGGGQAGDYIYGNDIDDDLHKYGIKIDEETYDIRIEYVEHVMTINHNFALLDAANIPYYEVEIPGEEGEDPTIAEIDYDLVAVTPAGYFALYDMENGNVRYFDLNDLGQFVGIAYLGSYIDDEDETDDVPGVTISEYLLLSNDGTLYLWDLYYDAESGGFGAEIADFGQIDLIPFGDNIENYSMTFAGNLTGEYAVFISDSDNGLIWYVNIDFIQHGVPGDEDYDIEIVLTTRLAGLIEGATNISTLFNLGAYYDWEEIVDTSMFKEIMAMKGSGQMHSMEAQLADRSEKESLPTEELPEPVAEVILPEKVDDGEAEEVLDADPVDGTVNTAAILERKEKEDIKRITVPNRNTDVTDETEDGTDYSVVVYTEDVEVKNGCVTLSYDTKVAKFVGPEKGVNSPVDYTSVKVDEESGEIRFACAQLDSVAAGDAIAEFRFEKVCVDSDVKETTIERNRELGLSEENEETLKGIGHDWYFIGWNWEADELAYAEFRCRRDSSHGISKRADVTVDRTEPTADRAGKIVYTARTTFEGVEYVDSRTVVLPATGHNGQVHDYEFVGFEWSEDGTKATAVFKDLMTGETIRIDAQLSKTETPATYDAEGSIVYTATVEYNGKTYTDSKTVVLEKLDKEDDGKDDPTVIDDSATPQAGPDNGGKKMSILDAIFVIATLGTAVYLAFKKNYLGLILAAISAVVFFLTQGFGNGTVLADKWSIPMGVLLAIAILLGLMKRRDDEE